MKKIIYLFIASCSIGTASIAQNLVYPLDQNQVREVANLNYESWQIDVTTVSPEAITFDWEGVSNTFPVGWSFSLCDYGGCAVGLPPSGSMNPISLSEATDGMMGWFKMNLTTGEVYGNGKVEIYVHDAADYNRGDIVSWDVTHTESIENTIVEMSSTREARAFPNPATDILNFVNIDENVVRVNIFNMLGEAVFTRTNPTKGFAITLNDFNAGVYYVAFEGRNGKMSTQKIVIK